MIFLGLYKAYDALDRSRCINILKGYGVGPRACQLLRTYWSRLRMVEKAEWYYRVAVTGARGVTQGDPLFFAILNVVVYVVVVTGCL